MSGNNEKARTAFECAAAYALCRERERSGQGLSGWLLVLDLDRCEAGLCTCKASGSILLTGSVQVDGPPPDSFLSELERLAGADARAQFAGQKDRVQRVYRRYKRLLEEQGADPKVYGGVTCSQLEEAFSKTGDALRRLFSEAEKLLGGNQADESELRILLMGAMAGNYLAKYLARKHFDALSPDPFLPDALFWPPDGDDGEDPALFAEKGRELYETGKVEESRPIGCRVALALLDGENNRAAMGLAEPEQTLAELETPSYSAPFLCCREEPVCLEIDGVRREIPIPEALFPAETAAEAVRAAVVSQGEGLYLSLCAADDPGHEARVPISIPATGS